MIYLIGSARIAGSVIGRDSSKSVMRMGSYLGEITGTFLKIRLSTLNSLLTGREAREPRKSPELPLVPFPSRYTPLKETDT